MSPRISPSWEQNETEKDSMLKKLQADVLRREEKLERILEGNKLPKWRYPEEAVKLIIEAQSAASENQELLTSDIKEVLRWPSPDHTHEEHYYEAKGPDSMFNRTKNWFAEEGFDEFETMYSFSDRWDKEKLTVKILVPKELPKGQNAPVMWFFHGGGFVSLVPTKRNR